MADEPREFILLCPHCGEQNPDEFPVCWSCHGDLPARVTDVGVSPARERPAAIDPLPPARRRRLELELAVALFVLWLPGVVAGVQRLFVPRSATSVDSELWGVFQDVGALALLAYFVWLDGDWRQRLGLVRPRLVRDGLVTLAVIASHLVSLVPVALIQSHLWLDPGSDLIPAYESAALRIAPIGFLVSALFEEVFCRAYLWGRLTELTRSPGLSIVISALLFAVAHVYPPLLTLELFLGACLQGLIFWRVRSLWGQVLGHTSINLWIVFG